MCVCMYVCIYIYISPPFWTSLPSPSPSHCSRLIQSPCLSFLRHTANSCWLSILHMVIKFTCYSFHTSHPLLTSPHVHKSVLYVCFSIAALHTNSSVSFFYILYTCISIWYLSFSFWFTSLCIIGSRFIHLIRTDSKVFLFWLSNIPLCICTTTSLFIYLLMDI